MCRSRRELSNEYLLAKFVFDTAENEPCKVCPLSAYRSLLLLQIPQAAALRRRVHERLRARLHARGAASCLELEGHRSARVGPAAWCAGLSVLTLLVTLPLFFVHFCVSPMGQKGGSGSFSPSPLQYCVVAKAFLRLLRGPRGCAARSVSHFQSRLCQGCAAIVHALLIFRFSRAVKKALTKVI